MKTRISGKTFDKKRLSAKDLLSLKGKKYERVRVKAQGLETSPPTAQVQEGVPQEVRFQGVSFTTKPTPGVSKSWDLVPKDDAGVQMGNLYMDDAGRVYDVDTQIGEIDEKRGASKKTAAEFKELFSSKYANWIKMQARLLAANNYGKWTSVEEASQHVDKATKEVAETLKKAVEGEVKRLVDEEREDILQDMTENMEFGPNLPQMGPDQTQMQQQPRPQAPMPSQQEPIPQKIAPPASKISRKAKMTKSLRAAFDKTAEEEEEDNCPVREERDSTKNRREVYEKSADLDDLLKEFPFEEEEYEPGNEKETLDSVNEILRGNKESLKEEIRLLEDMMGVPPTPEEILDDMDMYDLEEYLGTLQGPSAPPGSKTSQKMDFLKQRDKRDKDRKERREKRDKEREKRREKNKDSCPFVNK